MKKIVLFTVLAISALVIIFPESVLAVDSSEAAFGSQAINKHAESLSKFFFGPIAKLVAVVGAAFGVFTSLLTSNYQRLAIFLGIGTSVVILPEFIKSAFSLLLP
ncbi:MAG: hypothetical protein CK425_11225 [Parachlamydia sp.]|nr:MAG: hypothetical protein CK425_11225 [Parachlamydia sp.]